MASKFNVKTTNSGHKMPVVVVTCYKCKNLVDIKKTAICSLCKNRYDLDCDGYPEKTYRLMDQERKKKWRCKTCIKNKKDVNSDITNITVRKKQNLPGQCTSLEESCNTEKLQCIESLQVSEKDTSYTLDSHVLTDYNISDVSFSTPSKLSKSVDGTMSETTSISEMKSTISQLTCNLRSTQNELENIILENNDLHRQINKLTSEIKILKSLCYSPTKIDSPQSGNTTKKKRHPLLLHSLSSVPSSPTVTSYTYPHPNSTISSLQQKITNLQQELKDAEKEIASLNKKITNLTQNIDYETKDKWSKTSKPMMRQQNNSHEKIIYIIGSQQCVGLSAAISHSRSDTQYEHYGVIGETKPYAPSNEVIKNCHNMELKSHDKLVICLGENDHNIKQVLSQLQAIIVTFSKNTIIVLNVIKNRYINVNNLNYRIKNICERYKNCKFIDCKKYSNRFDICKSINYAIDYSDYEEKYLNPSEISKRIASNRPSFKLSNTINKPKKGTIPFYFKKKLTRTQNLLLFIRKGPCPIIFR
ncbi:unnamed protein product [Parnassius mnemosyne]|uniref:Uncharacterized protein n=1 Tax=Parnassius mnemosyne TaxID=213953 RepID=A0AAV1KDZ2_9NEOP